MREQGPAPGHNLFRRKDRPDLHCAVPESRPVPPFLRAPAWEHVGQLDRSAAIPGFDGRAARIAMQLHDFYAFDMIH